MAVTVASITSAIVINNTSAITTGAFTPSDGVLLVALFWGVDGGTPTTPTVTDSLGGTWTQRLSNSVVNGDTMVQYLYTRPVVTGASMTVSANFSGSVLAKHLHVLACTGANNTTPVGASVTNNAIGNTTGAMTLSASPASSSAVIAARGIMVDDLQNAAATPGSGWTEHFDTTTVDRGGIESQSRISSTSNSVVWVDVNSTAATNFGCVGLALEVVAAAGSSRMSTNVNFF